MSRIKTISEIDTRNITHLSREDQHRLAKEAFDMSSRCLSPVRDGVVDVAYKNNTIDPHNPLVWSYGHILFFWEVFFCRFVYPNQTYPILNNVDNLYDSFVIGETNFMSRFNDDNHSLEQLSEYAETIWKDVEKWTLHSKKQAKHENYAFMTCLLHTHMHIECFLFDYQMFNMRNPLQNNCPERRSLSSNQENLDLEMVTVVGDNFMQGSPNDGTAMVWDNELSRFKTFVKTFQISKYPITQKQYLGFVVSGGYADSRNWSIQGEAWRKKTHSTCPLYWTLENGVWHRLHFGIWVPLEPDFPMMHVNYYEAEAYCNWAGGRLALESEWEYVATEGGTNNKLDPDACNLDYEHGDIRSVKDGVVNSLGVGDMIGNVWCWCKDPFYPYPNYNIEPLYREFSYPFFGYKMILRGGCWAVPKILISKFYRNAQPADMRKQFTGFRLVREYNN